MIKWLVYAVLNFPLMLICYITNPFVVLFCDKHGELPYFLRYWQTWDDSCDPRFFVMDKVPSFLRYDYDAHYSEEYQGMMPKYGRKRWYAYCYNDDFTMKESIQRYLCRVLWLTRNCGYGLAFYLFGEDVEYEKMVVVEEDGLKRGWYKDIWMYKNDRKPWKHFLGWKMPTEREASVMRCMLAYRIAFRFD